MIREHIHWNLRKLKVLLTGDIVCPYYGEMLEVIDKPDGHYDFVCHNTDYFVQRKIFTSAKR